MKARIHVTLKPGVLDTQGEAVRRALVGLGFDSVRGVRQGKLLEVELADDLTSEAAESEARKMCEKLLANAVIENFSIDIA